MTGPAACGGTGRRRRSIDRRALMTGAPAVDHVTVHRRFGATILAALVVAALTGAAPAQAGTVALPFEGFGGMTVDAAHAHLFISGGPGSDQIAVYSLGGTFVKTFDHMPGATDMVVHDGVLYVALYDGAAIGRIDTATLTRMTPVGLETLLAPRYLAAAAGRIWVSSCANGQVGSIAADGTGLVLDSGFSGASFQCYDLESTPAKPRRVFAGETVSDPTTLVKLRASVSGTLSWRRTTFDPGVEGSHAVNDMAIRHDGAQVLLACGTPDYVQAFGAAMFRTRHTYPTGPEPVAVDVSPDDAQVAAGRRGPDDPDVYVFPYRSQIPTFAYDFGSSSDQLADEGLAFTPDGTVLFAVSVREAVPATLYRFDLAA